MATMLDAFKKQEDFRRLQVALAARARTTAFPRTTSIMAFTGVLLICLTLSKIPKIEGGYPLVLNHEVLLSFAVCSVSAILLNLSIVLMNLLSRINESKFDKAAAAVPVATSGVEIQIIEKCLANQKKIIDAIEFADRWIFIWGSVFRVYAFQVALIGYFVPYREVSSNYGNICAPFVQFAMSFTIGLKLLVDGFPKHWEMD